jgi:hypothetical protein
MASRSILFVDLTATACEGRRLGATTSALGLAPDVGTARKCSAAFTPAAAGDGDVNFAIEPAVRLFLERLAVAAPQLERAKGRDRAQGT